MATKSLTVDVSPIGARVEKFIDFLTEQLDKQNDIFIADIFILLPINPKNDATKRRLERRGTINVDGNNLSVQAPPEDNQDFRGTFNDRLGNLGRIVVTFKKKISATTSQSNGNLVIDFGQSAIPVRISALAAHPQLSRNQALHKIEVFGHEQVVFYFRDQGTPGLEVELTAVLKPQDSLEAGLVEPLSALISSSLLRMSSGPDLLSLETTNEGGSQKAGTAYAVARHRDTSTFWDATGVFCWDAQQKALAECKEWAESRGKDPGECKASCHSLVGTVSCFIATAVTGSDRHPYVVILQDFRDMKLKRSRLGRRAIKIYYSLSPSIAAYIAPRPILRRILLLFLIRPSALLASAALNWGSTRIENC